LLERYRASLYGRALRLLGHGSGAQDAVQDTFVIALLKIDQIREPEAVGGWLHAILRNVCLMRIRGDHGEVLFDEMPRRIESSFESSVEEAIDRLAMRDWVWTALGELPESLRVTAMLRYFGGYPSYGEISAILGVPVGTVKSRLNAARIQLAESLLETAGLEHDGARRLTESRTRFYEAAWGEYSRGEGCDLLLSDYRKDVVVTFHEDPDVRGIEWLLTEFEGDLEAGMKLTLTNVVASKDVSIVEGDFENPRDDPFRCPPAVTFVGFHRDGGIERARLYFAPRKTAVEEGGENMPYRPRAALRVS
ncbi:MAG: RNA polymerase sigma factor, partial [Rubrobacteraceae bacterium]